jgi:hypothetical protein
LSIEYNKQFILPVGVPSAGSTGRQDTDQGVKSSKKKNNKNITNKSQRYSGKYNKNNVQPATLND